MTAPALKSKQPNPKVPKGHVHILA